MARDVRELLKCMFKAGNLEHLLSALDDQPFTSDGFSVAESASQPPGEPG